MGHENIIELNGKRYDAFTGALLGASSAKAAIPLAVPVAPSKVHGRGKVIDGFIRSGVKHVAPKNTAATAAKKTPKAAASVNQSGAVTIKKPAKTIEASGKASAAPIETATKPGHHAAGNAKAHQPQHAQTLMRHVVPKPTTTIKPAIKVQTAAEVAVRPTHAITAKHSAYQVDARRLAHAQETSRHTAIQHFENHPVIAAAAAPRLAHISEPAPRAHAHHAVPAPVHHTSTGTAPHRDIFEAAIARANSHEQPKHHDHKRFKRRRITNIAAGAAAFLVIAGFIGYLNMPNIELRVASFQAGFGAQMPGYTPTGFALRDGVQRTGNTVSIKYQSGDQSYTITQQPSDWNSQTLVDNTLALNGSHKTLNVGGRTIYIYGGSNAVWVDGNVRYDVIGNAALSDSDITALANSL